MADFAAILRKNLEKLGETTPELRQLVYGKARAALQKKIDAMDPAPPVAAVARQFGKLNTAVEEVETEYLGMADAVPTEPEPEPEPEVEAEAEVEAPAVEEPVVEDAPEPVVEDLPVEAEPKTEDVPEVVAETVIAPDVELEPIPDAVPEEAPSVDDDIAIVTDAAAPADVAPIVEDAPVVAAIADNDDVLSELEALASNTDGESSVAAMPSVGDVDDEARALLADVDAPADPLDAVGTEVQTPPVDETDPLMEFLQKQADVLNDDPPKTPADAAIEELEAVSAQAGDRVEAVDDTIGGMVPEVLDDVKVAGAGAAAATVGAGAAAIETVAEKSKPAWGRLFGFLLVIAVAGGGVYAAMNMDRVRSVLGIEVVEDDGSGLPVRTVETTTVEPAEADTATETAQADVDAGNLSEDETTGDDQPETVVVGTGEDTGPKFTQRLTEDGREVDEGPAGGEPALGEGTSVSDQTEGTGETVTQAPDADVEAPAASEDQAAAEDAQEQSTPLRVGQRAIFYEERTGSEAGTAVPGSIIWSQVQESPGSDLPLEPAIRGEASIPDLDLSMTMTIRRNGDITFPASHIIEVFFDVPGTFSGRGVADVQRVTFKNTEQDPGTALIGVPAPIDTNIFLVALTDANEAVASNTRLMENETWIDVPMQYVSGRRALITLEKGLPGDRVFKDVFNYWNTNPLPGSG